MLLSGSQIIIECLKEQDVDTVFGYPGGTVINIYDELYKNKDTIKHILTSHEQGAAHAADGYARATGKVGVCIATSGPGASNLVTGIATAYMDSVPMVIITGNVKMSLLGKDSFQEVDIFGITMPITKYNFIVKDIANLAKTIRRAFKIAKTGRPGPVLVDIAKDVTEPTTKIEYKRIIPNEIERIHPCVSSDEIENIVELINNAKRPVIFVGGGVVISDAKEELEEFVQKVDAPVCDTLMGKGAFDGNDELYMGMLGMHGTKTSNLAVSECDLLIAIGVRFSDRIVGNVKKFAKFAKIIHIDVDPAEVNKNVVVSNSIIGDAKEVLKKLNEKIYYLEHEEWKEYVNEMKEAHPLAYDENKLTGPYILEQLYKLTKGDAIITTEVGQHQIWTAQFYKFNKPRTLITSGGLGTMGFGLGASIGAKIAVKDKLVFNIAGDGCFRMNMNEIATATRYNVPIIEIVFNNHALGMVRQWQELYCDKRFSQSMFNDKVDFVKIAEGMGAKGFRITKKSEVEEVLKKAIELNDTVVIDCILDSEDMVWPMVTPGEPIYEAFSEEDMS